MKVLAVGGGSGGHVTPIVAVLRELKEVQPHTEIRFWCDRKFAPQAKSIMHTFDASVPVSTIHAGKLRRYNTLSFLEQLLRPSIVFPNLRDGLLVGLGFIESIAKLLVWRPDVIFTKGGFVCLPVGLAARVLRIPLVIHDSDAHPGLTNRVLARSARLIATGAPLHHYNYPSNKSRYVGIPIGPEFRPFTAQERREGKRRLGFNETMPLLVVTGGGLGAKRVNDTVLAVLDDLLSVTSVLLISGADHYDELRARLPEDTPQFQLKAFISENMAGVLGASDVVITRAGATTIMELAALAKPAILIPNAYLTGGHQLKNAAVYAETDAVVVLDEQLLEEQPSQLAAMVKQLLGDEEKLTQLQANIFAFAKPQAAREVADMIISTAKKA